MRYQLLTALAGTAIEAHARDADRAVLLVHEFVDPAHTTPGKLATNARHLRELVAALPGVDASVLPPADAAEWLLGPILVPGASAFPADLPGYVGKLRTALPAHAAG